MNKKGFTLVELLAIIVLLGVLISLATSSVNGIIDTSRKKAATLAEQQLKETTITYVKDKKMVLKKCAVGFIVDGSNLNNECVKEIKVETLLESGLFKDEKGYCNKDATIAVYRYVNPNNNLDEIRAYIHEGTCQTK